MTKDKQTPKKKEKVAQRGFKSLNWVFQEVNNTLKYLGLLELLILEKNLQKELNKRITKLKQ